MSNYTVKEYLSRHPLCPVCGSANIEMTTEGRIYDPDRPFRMDNTTWCHDCGWKGITHDLITPTK